MPLGLGAAIYLSEYASPRVRAILKPVLEMLAGIPTVVFGYFALDVRDAAPAATSGSRASASSTSLAAGLVMGVMIMPIVASLSEDAMARRAARPARRRVRARRDASCRWRRGSSSRRRVSGIVAAFVLAISRAIGETMIVLIAAGQQART